VSVSNEFVSRWLVWWT